ncbi:MAG: hypothetical protein VB858_22245 [Planctomycetaceae bacterium]
MDQKFEGIPAAVIRLDGNRLVRGHVSNDWGLRLQWKITRGDETVAVPLARISTEHELQELPPGMYGAVLQMWKYVNYKKDKDGEFTVSKYVDISNSIGFEVSTDGRVSPVRITQPATSPRTAAP